MNSIFLILILKVENPDVIDSYRPIVLGNILFKVTTKINFNRLRLLVSQIIFPNKFGFIKATHLGLYCYWL